MTVLFLILIVISCIILGFIILVQNPKGGGLAGNIAGISNQFMGVKQTNDVLERGTWIFAGLIGLLCLFSTLFMSGTTTNDSSILNSVNTSGAAAPAQQAPAQQQPAPAPAPAQQQPK